MRGTTTFGDHALALASRASPIMRRTLRRYGDRPVRDYLASIRAARRPAPQGLDDLCAAVEAEAGEHVEAGTAAAVAAGLAADPVVPTSNHFGIETVAESVQATVLFALRPQRAPASRHVLVLGFGSISMNNWSYPMGLRLYDPRHGRLERLPQRLPVFPNRLKQRAVCAAGPYDAAMLRRARARLDRMAADGEVTPFAAGAAGEVLDGVLGDPAVLSLPSYRAQSPVVNAALWRRMLGTRRLGDLVQLQAERVCARLLRRDLLDGRSLAHKLLFVDDVRERLLDGLDGAQGCWLRAALAGTEPGTPRSRRGGTLFFWGLSTSGRRVPLTLRRDGGAWALAGAGDHDAELQVALTPEAIGQALDDGRLLPSLFTCFAVLAFARGLACVGGYYQAEYLPVMRDGVARALAAAGDHHAELVGRVPAGLCIAGLQGLVRPLDSGEVLPAGPVELAGMGGVGDTALDALTAMPVRDATLVAFTELLDILVPGAELPDDWVRRLATENAGRAVARPGVPHEPGGPRPTDAP